MKCRYLYLCSCSHQVLYFECLLAEIAADAHVGRRQRDDRYTGGSVVSGNGVAHDLCFSEIIRRKETRAILKEDSPIESVNVK